MIRILVYFLPLFALSIVCVFAVGPMVLLKGTFQIIAFIIAPFTALFFFPILLGILSRIGLHGIKEGKFMRSLSDPVYGPRRVHSSCWTMLYYCQPVYHFVLSVPLLKWLVFRCFGYRGPLNFIVYPDAWLRDLPLLNVGGGAYLSNKSSIATNICLSSGSILVEGIQISDGGLVGHGSIVGPGTRIGNGTQIEASVTSGIRVLYGDNVVVGEMCGIQHGVRVGSRAKIEACSVLGLRVKIGSDVHIREGSHIHTGIRIRTQAEADAYYSNETGSMTATRQLAMSRFKTLEPLADQDEDGVISIRDEPIES